MYERTPFAGKLTAAGKSFRCSRTEDRLADTAVTRFIATELNPANFPLGSVQSRAAARIVGELKQRKSAPQTDVYPPGWSPKTVAQRAALESPADILFFGGAAGSLKTETMLVDAARESNNPNLNAIIFRQQFTHMTDIVEKTHRLYKPMGATYVGAPAWTWTFPSGAKIRLAYISSDKDIWEYLGPRYSLIGFDESTLHTEYQVRNMLGRLSSTDRNLRLRVRLASNPGNTGAAWHKTMFLRGACPVHGAADRCAEAASCTGMPVGPPIAIPFRTQMGAASLWHLFPAD